MFGFDHDLAQDISAQHDSVNSRFRTAKLVAYVTG